MLKDMGDKIGASDRQAMESAMADVKGAIEKNDPAKIKSALDRLTAVQHKLAETLYQQAAPGTGPASDAGAAAGGGAPKSDVIDAEVVDDEKK